MTNTLPFLPVVHIGNNLTCKFSFDFKISEDSDITVYLKNRVNQIILSLHVDYEIEFDEKGGSIIFKNAPAALTLIIITRNTPQEQPVTIETSSGFGAKVIEELFDKIISMIQEINYDNLRSVKVAIGSEKLNLLLPAPAAHKSLIWNEEENELVNSVSNIDELGDAVQTAITSSNGAIETANTANQLVKEANAKIILSMNEMQKQLDLAENAAAKSQEFAGYSKRPLPVFSVNSGSVDDDGNANFLKIENNIITAIAPFVATTASGYTYSVKDDVIFDVFSLDVGDYNVFFDPVLNEIVCINNLIIKQKSKPQNVTENTIWINISVEPFAAYILKNDVWILTDLIPLGKITIEPEDGTEGGGGVIEVETV